MRDDDEREWNFQLNIAGLTLLLFAAGYIGQHVIALASLEGWSRIVSHYLGELVLTVVAFGYALSRAYGASRQRRDRVSWLEGSIVWFHVGLAAVALNVVLLTTLVVLGRLP